MKFHALTLVVAAAAIQIAQADEPVGFSAGTRLMNKYRCQSCHAIDKTLSGPSFRDIAKRYADDPHARDEIATNIVNGSSGAWGTPNAMPPSAIPRQDLKPLVEWILSLGQ
jgi:cytochrome c